MRERLYGTLIIVIIVLILATKLLCQKQSIYVNYLSN